MYWIDIVAIILTLILAYRAQQQGLLISAMRLIGLIFGIIVAINLGPWASDIFIAQFNISVQVSNILGYVAIFLVIVLASQIVGFFLRSLIHAIKLGWLDRIGGIFLGTLKAAIIISLIFWVLLALPSDSLGEEIQQRSYAYKIIGGFTPALYEKYVQPNLEDGDMKDRLDSLIAPNTKAFDISKDFENQIETLDGSTRNTVDDMKERFKSLELSKQMQIMTKLSEEKPNLQEIINILYSEK